MWLLPLATAIVAADSHYHATMSAGLAAINLLKKRVDAGALNFNRKEADWLSRIERDLQSLPDDEAELLAEMKETHAGIFEPESYGLA